MVKMVFQNESKGLDNKFTIFESRYFQADAMRILY